LALVIVVNIAQNYKVKVSAGIFYRHSVNI